MSQTEKSKKKNIVISLSLTQELLDAYGALASRTGITRNAMIKSALRWYLDYCDSLTSLSNIVSLSKKLDSDNSTDKDKNIQ